MIKSSIKRGQRNSILQHCYWIKFTRLVFLLIPGFLYSSCTRLPNTSNTQSCTFTFSGFFGNCKNPVTSSNIIPYTYEVKVFSSSGSSGEITDKTGNSPTGQPDNSFSVTGLIPKSGTWRLEFYIIGTACSICSSGHGPPNEGVCTAVPVYNGLHQLVSYYAAKPQLSGAIYVYDHNSQYTYTLSNSNYSYNVANSCGCSVSEN